MNDVIAEAKKQSKLFINANIWDGEDRSGCLSDWCRFTPDDLQELVDDLIEDITKPLLNQLEKQQEIVLLSEQILLWHNRSEVDYQGFRDIEKALDNITTQQ